MKDIISPVDTEDGLFHDGDPSTGTEGTVVSQKWLNPVQGAIISNQQELASVLKEAGIKIDPAKQDQLLAAIKKITGSATEGFLKTGDYGLGGAAIQTSTPYKVITSGFTRYGGGSTDPDLSNYGGLINIYYGENEKHCFQLYISGDPTACQIRHIQNSEVDWSAKIYHEKNPPPASEISGIMDAIYPIGIVTWFAQNKNPNQLFPGTKWKYIGENRTIRLAKQDGTDLMQTGGSDSVTLNNENLPAHSHEFSANTNLFDYGSKDTSWFDYGDKGTDVQGAHNHLQGVRSGTSAHMFGTENVSNDYGFSGTGNADKTIAPYTSTSGNHGHTVSIGGHAHSVGIGAHSHSVSGNTSTVGAGTAVSVANPFIKLMAWYRES
jgi:hypothetical protein